MLQALGGNLGQWAPVFYTSWDGCNFHVCQGFPVFDSGASLRVASSEGSHGRTGSRRQRLLHTLLRYRTQCIDSSELTKDSVQGTVSIPDRYTGPAAPPANADGGSGKRSG